MATKAKLAVSDVTMILPITDLFAGHLFFVPADDERNAYWKAWTTRQILDLALVSKEFALLAKPVLEHRRTIEVVYRPLGADEEGYIRLPGRPHACRRVHVVKDTHFAEEPLRLLMERVQDLRDRHVKGRPYDAEGLFEAVSRRGMFVVAPCGDVDKHKCPKGYCRDARMWTMHVMMAMMQSFREQQGSPTVHVATQVVTALRMRYYRELYDAWDDASHRQNLAYYIQARFYDMDAVHGSAPLRRRFLRYRAELVHGVVI